MRQRPVPSRLALFLSAVGFAATLSSVPASACGPYPFDTRFFFDHRPGVAQHRAVRGELGVFEPHFDTAWVFAAWRQLAGPGLEETDRERLVWLLMDDDTMDADPAGGDPRGVDAWQAARRDVVGAGGGWINPTREQSVAEGKQRSWFWFDNCLDDSFETAAETLRARVAKYGDHPAVREWLRGQDAVFENCSGGLTEPAELPAEPAIGWPEWLQKDRTYQRAAAALYSERYDLAAERFAAIAGDADSPWQAVSGYLVGRALARAGRHTEAIESYRAVLDDPAAANFHASARGLIDHLRYRDDPDALRADVVARLSGSSPLPESLEQDLVDFHRLAGQRAFERDEIDPLTDWYRAVKGWTQPGDVMERWHRERGGEYDVAWRWAALLRANAGDVVYFDGRQAPALPAETIHELLDAPTLEPGTTGAVSEAYHRARLLLDTGRADEAVPILERAIQGEYGSVATADTNLFLIQRLRAAGSLEDIVRFGQMFPTEVGWNYGDNGPLGQGADVPTWKGGPLWHLTAAKMLNGLSPSALAELVTPESVTDPLLRAETLRVAWTRAVVLDEEAEIASLAGRLSEVDPQLAPQLEPLRSAPAVERGFLAARVILRHPGLHPDLHWGVSRPTAVDELDVYYSDWWCSGETFELPEPADLETLGAASPENLDARNRLAELPTAPIWLGRKVIAYADAHPDDPRVPEALHLVVRTTRHGCKWGTESFAEVSKSAFQRLHQRYPNSPWAEKTPYWFD